MLAAMQTLPGLGMDALVTGRHVLHLAPEYLLTRWLKSRAGKYTTADLNRDDVDLKLDMCNMSAVTDDSLDLVIACDVLEHVDDDGKALDEVLRVLRPGGWAILTVPQKDGLATTYQDTSITTDEGRLEAFGQHDHLRIYGDDFPDILTNHGFAVTTVTEADFTAAARQRNVLFPPVLSPHPLATNYRKVFFARKT